MQSLCCRTPKIKDLKGSSEDIWLNTFSCKVQRLVYFLRLFESCATVEGNFFRAIQMMFELEYDDGL